MVLGFGTRSSKRKSKIGAGGAHVVRVSPSLPEMKSQGLSWPSNLVDVAAIRATPPSTPTTGPGKVSFSAGDAGSIPFHRPFRRASVSQSNAPSIMEESIPGHGRPPGGIASLYMSQPPSAFSARSVERSGTPHSTRTRHTHSQRKKAAPTFNLMVAGAQGTGKVRSGRHPCIKSVNNFCRVRCYACSSTQQIYHLQRPQNSARQWTNFSAPVESARIVLTPPVSSYGNRASTVFSCPLSTRLALISWKVMNSGWNDKCRIS